MIKEFLDRIFNLFLVRTCDGERRPLRFVTTIVLFSLVLVLGSCGGDRTFEKQWDDGFQEANKIFIARGLCQIRHVCEDRNSMYVMGMPFWSKAGFQVEIYGIKDPEILSEIAQVFTKKFLETQNMRRLVVTAYAFTKKEDLTLPFAKKWHEGSIFELDMKR